jgi:hypothetical protein
VPDAIVVDRSATRTATWHHPCRLRPDGASHPPG